MMVNGPDHDEAKIRHLEMIQGVITRMASNSFALKALAVTLTAGVLAFTGATKSPSPVIVLAALLPVVMFWCLDAQYLRLERLYRRLFDAARADPIEPAAGQFSMNIGPYQSAEETWLRIALSWSVFGIYLPIVAVLAILAAVLLRS